MSVLDEAASAVADGIPVAWSTIESAALSDAERASLRELRLIAGISSFHATLHSGSRLDTRSSPAKPPSQAEPPFQWGALQVIELIGRGAFGDVYRAWDPRLDREVALKLIRSDDADPGARGADVIEEGRVQARVHHSGVITVYGADRIEGRVGLWMELIEGDTLEVELRARGPFPAEEVVQIGVALCEAVGAVHEAGLLHRDVKAQNVMRHASGRLVLADFGTGQALEDGTPSGEPLTPGGMAGTPLYLAPELFEGQAATRQSELYSLGVLLYHLATGSYPVGGRTVAELRAAHRAGRRTPLGEQRGDLPERVARAIERSIHHEAGQRQASIADLRRELAGSDAWRDATGAIGSRIGAYQLTALVGEGGVGPVYRARDRTHSREVALRVLSEAFTDDPNQRARFGRETALLTSLRHPNIAQVYGLEAAEGATVLIRELVDGPTLADRIAHGAMPPDEALSIARQIAEALNAAHGLGILHRDLQPANIGVRDDGTVKVLDFGLTDHVGLDLGGASIDPAAAIASVVLTRTAAYLSPEQADGQAADRRSDVWAFGCVLYEMLTGRRAFVGDTVFHTLAAVRTQDVDLDALPTDTSSAVRRLVRRCLERAPERRLRDIADGLLEFDEGEEVPPPVAPTRRTVPWVAGAAVGAVLAGLIVWTAVATPPPPPRDALSVLLPADISLPPDMNIVAAMSPDGRDLVYVGQTGNRTQLFHRPLDQVDAVPMADTDGAVNPFFSPDGEWVGFKVGNSFRKVSLAGGASVKVCDLPENPVEDRFELGAAWSQDDMIWFGHSNTGLYRVAAAGGVPQLMTAPGAVNEVVTGHYWPQPLPDGRAILYSAAGSRTVEVFIPETGEHRILAEGWRPWFAPSGHIVFSDVVGDGTLWALPFDIDRLEATGEPVQVREGVRRLASGTTQAYVGADGTLVYVPDRGPTGSTQTLVWVDKQGNEDPIDAPARAYRSPRVSPDGTRVAVGVLIAPGQNIWIHDLVNGSDTRLTDAQDTSRFPLWTQDSQRVVFGGGTFGDLAWKAADGTGEVDVLVSDPERGFFPSSWSQDGRSLVFIDWDSTGPTGFNLGMVTLGGAQPWEFLRKTEYAESSPSVSPDGRLLAYQSNDSGRYEIYVTPFPNVDTVRIKVSTNGGLSPAWSPAGGELYYRQGTDCGRSTPEGPDSDNDTGATSLEMCRKAMMSVTVDTEPTLTSGLPEVLFEDPYYSPTGRHYDVASDGRFLMLKRTQAPTELIVVRNWIEELTERAPPRDIEKQQWDEDVEGLKITAPREP